MSFRKSAASFGAPRSRMGADTYSMPTVVQHSASASSPSATCSSVVSKETRRSTPSARRWATSSRSQSPPRGRNAIPIRSRMMVTRRHLATAVSPLRLNPPAQRPERAPRAPDRWSGKSALDSAASRRADASPAPSNCSMLTNSTFAAVSIYRLADDPEALLAWWVSFAPKTGRGPCRPGAHGMPSSFIVAS